LLDGRGGDDIGTANLTINEVLNNEPIAQDDAFTGSLNTNVTGNLLVNNGNGPDTDPDNDPLSVTPGTFATANGSVTILANGDFTYTPNTRDISGRIRSIILCWMGGAAMISARST
jgi:hypothetical protein